MTKLFGVEAIHMDSLHEQEGETALRIFILQSTVNGYGHNHSPHRRGAYTYHVGVQILSLF